MKQEISRLLRHDRSLFVDPMKRWFRLFGLDIAVEPTRWVGENQAISEPESGEVIAPPGASVLQDKSPNRAPTIVDPYDGQLDPELVRDVFTAPVTPNEHTEFPEHQPHVIKLTAEADELESGDEEDSSTEPAETADQEAMEVLLEEPGLEGGFTHPPSITSEVTADTSGADGSDLSSHPTATSNLTADAPPTTMVRTMVEAIADRTPGAEQSLDLLPDGLEDLFIRNARINVGVKTLLLNLEPVDIRELTEELKNFAESIGASGQLP